MDQPACTGQVLGVSVQDIVNSFERTFYLDEDSGHREQYQVRLVVGEFGFEPSHCFWNLISAGLE